MVGFLPNAITPLFLLEEKIDAIWQCDSTFFGCVQTGDTSKRRRFSSTRLTEQYKELFVSDVEINIVECDEVAEPFCNVFEFYCCHG